MNRASVGAVLLFHACSAAWAAAPNPRQVMAAVFGQANGHESYMRAQFEAFDHDGHATKKVFTVRRMGLPGDRRTLVTFTGPEEIRGMTLLSIKHGGLAEEQYIYVPATQRVRSVAEQQRSARFIGTDFSFEDVGDREVDDATYDLLGDAEVVDGRRTFKIAATPVAAAHSQYRAIHYWVAQDAPVIVRAEMYDGEGRLLRALHADEIRHVAGLWGARRLEMRTVPQGTRTVLTIFEARFDQHFDEHLFTPEGLAAAPGDAGAAR